jgi:hypothetical protein
VFAERQPEVAGSPNAIVDAFAAALKKTGGMGGAPVIVVVPHDGDGTIDRVFDALPNKVENNRNGLRSKLQQAMNLPVR